MISIAAPSNSPWRIPQTSLGQSSIAVAAGMFALVTICVGGLGPASPRLLLGLTSTLLFALSLGLIVLLAYRQALARHIGYLMMLFGIFYWFLSPAFLMSLQSDADVGDRYGMMLRPQSIATACSYVAIYLLSSVMVYWWVHGVMESWVERTSQVEVSEKLYLGILALFLAGFIPYLLFGGSIESILQTILAGRSRTPDWKAGALGDERSAIYYLSRSGMVAAAGFAGSWALLSRVRSPRLALIGMFVVTTIIVFFDGGTRSWVALTIMPAFLAWFALTMNRNVTLGRLLTFALIICAIQLSFEAARASRNRGWNLDRVKTVDVAKRHFDNDFFTDLAVSVDLVPRRHHYFHLGDLWAFVTHPIPRFIWDDKPISPVLIYYNDSVHSGLLGKRGNKLPSHLGQFHMSFGFMGVLAMGLLSGLISAWSSSLMCSRFVGFGHFGALLATWWFLMTRGLYPGWIYVVLFAGLILALGFRYLGSPATNGQPVSA